MLARSAAAGLHAVPADEGARPDEYLRRRRLVRHLDALPLEQRHALVLHHVLELTVPEIARELATPEETVRSRLRLARLRLRESLAPSLEKETG
ncbi:MAG TPA: sigma factor-like helix-turn-helix DNA-binding protein [Polyangiaceae bacterium]|nr:sigma factor-like helix-turn-helix DNA-binding protein [Polyangiaceae bacterium]